VTACLAWNSIIQQQISPCNGHVDHLCQHTAIRGHQKRVISSYNEFKYGRPTGNVVQYHSTQCDSILECEACSLVEISSPTRGCVSSTCNVTEMCVAFNNCRTNVDNKQCFRRPSIFTTMRQCGSYGCPDQDNRSMMLNDTATIYTDHWVMCTAISINNWTAEECVHAECQRTEQI